MFVRNSSMRCFPALEVSNVRYVVCLSGAVPCLKEVYGNLKRNIVANRTIFKITTTTFLLCLRRLKMQNPDSKWAKHSDALHDKCFVPPPAVWLPACRVHSEP